MEQLEFEFLSLVINHPNLLERNILKPEYFEPKNEVMYSILLKEYSIRKEFIIYELSKHNNFDIEYFCELLANDVVFGNKEIKFEEMQKSIIDVYKKRKYKEVFNTYQGDYENAYKQLTEINEINYQENSYITYQDMLNSLTDERKGLKLGFSELDKNLNLSQNDLIILAGSTGGGKTAFALNLLNNLSTNYQCVYFNMEMSKNILFKRLCAMKTGITMQELNNFSKLEPIKKAMVSNALCDIEEKKILLMNGSITPKDIRKNILNVKTDKHIVIFLDHIGLIKSSGNSLYEKMTNVAKELRTICLDCNCTIIGLCQLSRESQKNNDIPKLQDLRDSGEIEQSARKVLLLHDKDKEIPDRVHKVDVIVAKNDDGSRVVKEFLFDRYTQRFSEREKNE